MSPTLQSVENFISFSCLVALARTMLNRNGESRYLGFVHNFRRKYSD